MADVLRLQIVYETSQAVSGLQHLERGQRAASLAAVHLAQGLADGNISAITLARSVEHLGGSLGAMATGVGLAAAAFALWVRFLDNAAKLTASVTKEISASKDAMDELLGIKKTDTERQLIKLRMRIIELQDELNKPSWWDRFKALMSVAGKVWLGFESATQGAKDLGFGAADPRKKLLTELEKEVKILERVIATQEAIALGNGPAGLAGMRFHGVAGVPGIQGGFHPGAPAPFGGGFAGARGLDLSTHPAVPQVEPAIQELTSQQKRIVDSWTAGLHTMQDSLEEFLVTGKFVFQQLVDDLLRIAFRAATDQLVDKAVDKVFSIAAKSGSARRALSKP